MTKPFTYTPWGPVNACTKVADGLYFYDCPQHGGFHISEELYAKMPPVLQDGYWYEQDCAFSKVVCAFPELFPEDDFARSKCVLRTWYPEAFESHFNETILPGESYIRDKQLFGAENANNWVVISAIGERNGMVKCWATLGGVRTNWDTSTKIFAVPEKEYEERVEFGFVIDPTIHLEYDVWAKSKAAPKMTS